MNLPHRGIPTDNLKKLATESRETIRLLEDRVAAIATRLEQEPGGEYFLLGTADLQASVYYAPLYNLPQAALKKISREPHHTLLREIREKFLVNVGPTGFLREVCRSIRRCPEHDGDLFFIQLGKNGNVMSVQCFNGQAQARDLTQIVKETLEALPKIGPELKKFITELRSGLGKNKHRLHTYFLIRAEPRFHGPKRSAELDIMQIGVAFLNSPRLTEHEVSAFQRLAKISSFATISLLYEKERYYEKAIRQAVRGSIIKYGERSDIGNQVRILKALQDDEKWHVPTVKSADPILSSSAQQDVEAQKTTANEFAWYSMPWFVIPSLMDVISLTGGFERYEIAALIRAGFNHVHYNYWREDIQLQPARLLPSLLVPLALAIDSAETTFGNITSQTNAVLAGIPVKLARGIDVFSKAHLKRLLTVLNPILNRGKFSVELSWNEKVILKSEVTDAIAQLKGLIDTIASNISKTEDVHRLRIRGKGKLHGDAHFGNLLVDASVPEDPFIISIDPNMIEPETLSTQIKESTLQCLRQSCGDTDLQEEIGGIASDLSYDVAKFMLSTSCCYGLVYRNGFVIKPNGKRVPVFHLTKNDEEGPEKLKDAGGISGAQIVRIGPKVQLSAWDNHSIAASRALHEYISLQYRHQGKSTNDCFHQAVNVGLIRLWLFTVRHAFSIAGKLFPVKMAEATAMYLIGTLFVNRGLPTIQGIVSDENRLKAQSTEQELTALFFWDTKLDI